MQHKIYVMLPYLLLPGGHTVPSDELGVGARVNAFTIDSRSLSLNVMYSISLQVWPKLKFATSTVNLFLDSDY